MIAMTARATMTLVSASAYISWVLTQRRVMPISAANVWRSMAVTMRRHLSPVVPASDCTMSARLWLSVHTMTGREQAVDSISRNEVDGPE